MFCINEKSRRLSVGKNKYARSSAGFYLGAWSPGIKARQTLDEGFVLPTDPAKLPSAFACW
jgi:hypothetical protein